jgi:glycosyltransferase involved in cell wall biosynthesis
MKNVLICSHHPLSCTEYGTQGYYLAQTLLEKDINVYYYLVDTPLPQYATHRLSGIDVLHELDREYLLDIHIDKTEIYNKIVYYGSPNPEYPSFVTADFINHLIKDCKADEVICMFDMGFFDGKRLQTKSSCYFAPSYLPIGKRIFANLCRFDKINALTNCSVSLLTDMNNARKELQTIDEDGEYEDKLNITYTPFTINKDIYKCKYDLPIDEYNSRIKSIKDRHDIQNDIKIITIIAENDDVMDKSNFNGCLQAFKVYLDINPKTVLFIFSNVLSGAINVVALARALNIPDKHIYCCNQDDYIKNKYTEEDMCNIYLMSDILLNPSRSERFGTHLIAAQYCGCPIITTNKFSMPELTLFGNCINTIQQEYHSFYDGFSHTCSNELLITALNDILNWSIEEREEYYNNIKNLLSQ